MILVITGTCTDPFDRLIQFMDEWSAENPKSVFIQIGSSQYVPKNCEYSAFLQRKQLRAKIVEAEFVICQGGLGSMKDCLELGKKVIAVPRYPVFNESEDNNQEELVRALEKRGSVIGLYDIKDLDSAIDRLDEFVPSPSKPSRIAQIIISYIDNIWGENS